jgi:hypothetical protein
MGVWKATRPLQYCIALFSTHVIAILLANFTGVTRSLTDYMKAVRGSRIDRYVIETNKLLIRLDKLLSADAPTDPSKRKGGMFTDEGFLFALVQRCVISFWNKPDLLLL